MARKILAGCFVLAAFCMPLALYAAEAPTSNAVPMSPAPKQFEPARPAPKPETVPKLDKSYYNFEAVPRRKSSDELGAENMPQEDAQPDKKSDSQAAPDGAAARRALEAFAAMQMQEDYTPLCTTLGINTSYTLDGTTTGGSYCYHFDITQLSKTQIFLVGQNANTDFSLQLVREEPDGSLTVLGSSDVADNGDESVLAVTEPGHYYWLIDANASDGSPFQFGAIVNTDIDTYELNDTAALSTPVPQPRGNMVGNMDSASDIDYFYYLAERGQDVDIQLKDAYGSGEWIVEYFTGTSWAPLDLNTAYRLSGLPEDFMLNVRVYPNPDKPLNSAHDYTLSLGSVIASSSNDQVGSNENLVRLGTNDFDPYLTTQVHNKLNWSIAIFDSTHHPLKGVDVNFNYGTNAIPATTDTETTDANGVASGSITLPDCSGKYTVVHTAPNGQTWRTRLDVGGWSINVPDAFSQGDVGVGGENHPIVTLGHICKQTYLP